MNTKRISTLLALGVLSLVAAPTVVAGPTAENPARLLSIHSNGSTAKSFEIAQQLHDRVETEVAAYEKNLQEGRYKSGNVREMKNISETMAQLMQLGRIADDLIAFGEPAGLDLQFREGDLNARISKVVNDYQELPKSVELIAAAQRPLESFAKNQEKLLPPIDAALDAGKIEPAAQQFYKLIDSIEAPVIWQPRDVRRDVTFDFNNTRNRVRSEVSQLRATQAAESLAAQRAKALPNYEGIENLVTTSVASVKETGQANWARQMLDGPALVDAWGDGWQKTQVKMLECYALDRLRESPTVETDQLLAAQRKFEQTMLTAMGDLVQADAARVAPDAVPELYTRYLQAIARVSAQAAGGDFEQPLQGSLNQLAQRNPTFAQDVASYEAATREALRWRQRTAAAYARRQQRDAQPLDALLKLASANVALKNRPMNANADISQLSLAAPPLVQDVAAVVVGKSAVIGDVAPVAETNSVSRLQDYFVSRCTGAQVSTNEIAALKHDLLVTENAPPLSLPAALAIATAEAGYLKAVGGEVTGVELESLLVDLIRHENSAHVAMDVTPDLSRTTMKNLLWQVDLKPTWVQHEYIFTKLP